MAEENTDSTRQNENTREENYRNGKREPRRSFWARPWVIVTGTLLLFVCLVFGVPHVIQSFTHESTDNAFLDADIVSVAPKIAGQVSKVWVDDNQFVKQGQLLLEIDPRDEEVALEQKKAALTSARANAEMIVSSVELFRRQIDTAQATAKESAADAAAAAATAERAKSDLARAEELLKNRTISQQEFDAAKTAASVAEANMQAANEKAASNRSKVAEVEAELEAGRKGLQRAEAQAKQTQIDIKAAELNASYTRILAPADGRVTRKAVQPGDYVQVGQKLLAIVPRDLYVTANFKETQLRRIRVGERVRVSIDAINAEVPGHVDSIMAGTGARFSLLPPENAVGNYVKVVQRVPVKIVFDRALLSDNVLGPGMSVVPSVRVSGFSISEMTVAFGAALAALLVGMLWWALAGRPRPVRSEESAGAATPEPAR